MSFHPDQKQKLDAWLKQHAPKNCPSCGRPGAWYGVHDGVYALPSVALDVVNPGRGLELVAITCEECAYTATYLAQRIGL